jgi:hypothetical protein
MSNIVSMEHVNVTIERQDLATLFYIVGMGFTRDPYMTVGLDNMWINLGNQQFHLPTRGIQVLRGHIGIVVTDLESLKVRLEGVKAGLAGSSFSFVDEDGYLAVTGPWGNSFRCYAADGDDWGMSLGIPYVEFTVAQGTAPGIGRFYQEVMLAPSRLVQEEEGLATRVSVGRNQSLIFRETAGEVPAYDQHHIAIYTSDFSGPYSYLKERGLIMEESNQHMYRFQEIVDPDTQENLFTIEHEVRSMRHPMFMRDLANRNVNQSLGRYVRGGDRL